MQHLLPVGLPPLRERKPCSAPRNVFFFFVLRSLSSELNCKFQSSGAVWFIPDLLTLNLLQRSPRSLFLLPKEEPNRRFCSENFVADHSFNQNNLISAASLRLFGNEGVGGRTARMGYKALGAQIQTRTWPDSAQGFLKMKASTLLMAAVLLVAADAAPLKILNIIFDEIPKLNQTAMQVGGACPPHPTRSHFTELLFFFRTISWKI